MLQKSALKLFHPRKDVLSLCQSLHRTLKQEVGKKKEVKEQPKSHRTNRSRAKYGKSQ